MKTKPENKNISLSPDNTRYIPKKEYWMFGIGAFGQGMIYAVMSSFISDYYTNVLQLPLVFVMLMMMFARVWDAVNDPIMGVIVDGKTTKWGKMKPYVIFTAAPIATLTFLMFYSPNLSMGRLMVYTTVIYVLWDMVYTISDVPFWSLPNVMTPNPGERSSAFSFGRTLNSIGSALPIGLFFVLGKVITSIAGDRGPLETEKLKFLCIALIVSVLGILLFVNSYFHVKERIVIPNKPKSADENDKKGEKSALGRVLRCKPLMLVVLMGILSSGRYLMQAAAPHVARYAYYIGPPLEGMSVEERVAAIQSSISSVAGIFTVCAGLGMFGAMLCMPMLMKRFDCKKIVIATCLGGFVAAIATTLAGWFAGIYAAIPFIMISCVPLGVINIANYAMIGDSLDYMEWETGYRDTALGSACQSFVNKLGNAVATTGIIVMYMAINLEPSKMLSSEVIMAATDLAAGQRFAMFSLVSLVPGISLLLCAVPLFFYDITGEKKAKITRELAEQREARGIVIT
ncbi:MAG: MFS transporter [Oscillospiraceae bacterium]|nr:MFS transporter [Oscillospiraceae bacterium]